MPSEDMLQKAIERRKLIEIYEMLSFLSKILLHNKFLIFIAHDTFSFVDVPSLLPLQSSPHIENHVLFDFPGECSKLLLSNYVDGIKYCDGNFMGRKERESHKSAFE